MSKDFHITNREAFAHKVVEVARDCASAYRRAVSDEFDTDAQKYAAECCAVAASNTGFHILIALGYSPDDILRFAADGQLLTGD